MKAVAWVFVAQMLSTNRKLIAGINLDISGTEKQIRISKIKSIDFFHS